MTEGVSQEQLYRALGALEGRLGERFDKLEQKIDDHAEDDLLVGNRVLVIETQRDEEKKAALRRGTWAGILAAGGVTSLWEVLRHLWK
jgi:hypothetical protein